MSKRIGSFDVDTSDVKGKGGFGYVYGCKNRKTGEVCAMKQCHIKRDEEGALALQEIKNLQAIPPHKHIVRFIDFEYKDKSFWIAMEICDRGNLDEYIQR